MTQKAAFVFPGQGSQKPGMGRDVYDDFAEAREVFEAASDAVGVDMAELCFEGSEKKLALTENTQPAVLTVSSAILAALEKNSSLRPALVAGHSLGEYTAVVAAGGLPPGEAASIVRQRGRFMQDAVPEGEGGMAALIGASLEQASEICQVASEGDVLSPANLNSPGQIVIAGTKKAIDRAVEIGRDHGARRAILLPVSAPFHCELMRPAEEKLRPVLESASITDLDVPLVNNVEAAIVTSAEEVRDGLIRQVVSSVRWIDVVQRMVREGVELFVEIGPGNVLTGLIKKIDPSVETRSVSDSATLRDLIGEYRN